MQSGSNSGTPKQLVFERITDAGILSDFSCGINYMDDFIHNGIQDYISMGSCKTYVVREEEVIVAMFCLDNNNLCLSDVVKDKMHEGIKPTPQNAPDKDSAYWLRSLFPAVEISYLAVSHNRQRQHIGSYVIERIMDKLALDQNVECEFVIVRALKHADYTAVPFYLKCGFYPAEKEMKDRNLFMYRIVKR